jgi:pimeloyl-ACP methyl ester carboxylesterase
MHGTDHAADDVARQWEDKYFTSRDGLKLYYRDYAGPRDRPPLLMLHGLTRNSRDFERLAARYAGDWRVIAADFRGRGHSQYDPNSDNYQPPVYAKDVVQLLDELGIEQAVFLGTSLGGLVTMIVAIGQPHRLSGVLLNDIGPELDLSGIDRIKSYVGKPVVYRDWDDAADQLQARLSDVYPAYNHADWVTFAKRCCRETERGVEFDYDMRIAEPFNSANSGEATDVWPFYRALAGRPVLVLRGANSDLLSDAAVARMATEIPDVEIVTVPNVGHAPDLDEPESIAAIDRLLHRVLVKLGA